ncbi:MAG: prepilin-type N-terminal cleavage/methylation domain-containing protein [Bacillota bacterium]|jgi:prepilin-type N-terminal cleavage/methylation domain-containing protein|nr:MAG: prepilin-type N-terminal cleavage/methylation domain-containing protein [Bacillota bacterium]
MAIRKHLSGQKGFTLIELLVVVAILGILVGLAAPRVLSAIDNARARRAEADMVVIRDALERFYLDWGIFSPDLYYLISEDYIDPNFSFKNSYGNYYFYAVRVNETNDPNSPNYADYVLGDPGQTPLAAGTYDADEVCQGLYTTDHDVWIWGTWATAPSGLATSVTANNSQTGQNKTFNLEVTLLTITPATKPSSTAIKYSGQQP